MSDEQTTADLSQQVRIDEVCDRFEKALRSGESPSISTYLKQGQPLDQIPLLTELLRLDDDYRQTTGVGKLSIENYVQSIASEIADLPLDEIKATVQKAIGHAPPNLAETMVTGLYPKSDGNDDVIGTKIKYFGDYELLEELARGGMGVVYRAKQISLNRVIALKMILSGSFAGEEQIRRFQIEAESAANLDHPGIVPIYDIGRHEDQHYFSMKLIEGHSLADTHDQHAIEADQAVRMVRDIAGAVHHAHQRGILHRDLKPANILIDERGAPVITDFGLARQTGSTETSKETLTQAGVVVGTPGFMSPEQARGLPVTTATDIYSLGAILYKLLCGEVPHSGPSVMATVLSVINDPPTPPSKYNPDIDRDLELICLKCLAKEPNERYASAAELAEELNAHLEGRPLRVRPPSVVELTRMWLNSNYGSLVWVPFIATAIGITAGLSLWFATFGSDSPLYTSTYDRFPNSSRPVMLMSWTIPRPLWFVLFCAALMTIGWWTARLVKTKSRAADLGAGLSVGLLAGLICLVAGYAPMSIASGQSAMQGDLSLLEYLISNTPSKAMEKIESTYPGMKPTTPQEAAGLLKTKILGDLRLSTLPQFWLATLLMVGGMGLIGVFQTWVAGPLIRTKSASQALYCYFCFAVGLVTLFFPIWCESTMRFSMGGFGFIIDWTLPLICGALSLATIVCVIRNWPTWSQFLITVACAYSFVYFLTNVFLALPPPAVARLRSQIAQAESALQRNPSDPASRIELATAQVQFAAALDSVGWYDRAERRYRAALESLDAIAVQDESVRKKRLETIVTAATMSLNEHRPEAALQWIDSAESVDPNETELPRDIVRIKAQIYGATNQVDKMLRLIGRTDPTKRTEVLAAFQLIDASLEQRAKSLAPDASLQREWVRILAQRVQMSEESAKADRDLARQWLQAQATWRVFGPYRVENATSESEFTKSHGVERELLSGDRVGNLEPNGQVLTHPFKPVDLIKLFGETSSAVAYATAEFHLEQEQMVKLLVSSDDGVRVWIDGALVHSNPIQRPVYGEKDHVDVALSSGVHRIVVKVSQGKERWAFSVDAVSKSWRFLSIWHD